MSSIPGLVYLHFQDKTKLVPASKLHQSYSAIEHYIQTQFPAARGKTLEIKVDLDGMRGVSISRDAWCHFVDAQMDKKGPQVCAYTVEVEEEEDVEAQVPAAAIAPRPITHQPVRAGRASSRAAAAPYAVPVRNLGAWYAEKAYISQDFDIYVKTLTGKTLTIRTCAKDTVFSIKEKVQDKEGIPPDQQILQLAGTLLENERTLRSYGIHGQRQCTLWVFSRLRGGKPVILLHSPTEMDVVVRLGLTPDWSFSALYPVVPVEEPKDARLHQSVVWNVRTRPDGTMRDKASGADVSYLFWEALTNAPTQPSPPPSPVPGATAAFRPARASEAFKHATSVLLSMVETPLYLDAALRDLGLDTDARTSFITYWLPALLHHKHILLSFLPQAAYEKSAPLVITPTPDAITRVFMVFRGVMPDEARAGVWAGADEREATMWRAVVGVPGRHVQQDKALLRVLEWGGMEVK
ncbi:Ubiquitin family protein [Mycena kentingensis (nom. inval.)]|nr:Ubiquitin family protein [Mycena kentingensis (nom. inval.)]